MLEELENIGYVKPEDVPGIDLYMDQVTTFINSKLSAGVRRDSDKLLTKTMINNYAKNDLFPPPVKKKYTKEHVLALLFIYYFKNAMSIRDIKGILGPVTSRFFGKKDYSLEDVYREVVALEGRDAANIAKDLARKLDAASEAFADAPEEDADMLRTFGFLCMLSYDIYLRRTLLEKLVDHVTRPDDAK